jgi:hypothetical protein
LEKVSIEQWAGADVQWSNESQKWILTGPMQEILKILSKNKFTHNLVRANDRQWGQWVVNRWTGQSN